MLLIDFLVTNYILKETKISDPGKITDLRMALVNNVTFACLTVRYGFQKFLRFYSEQLKYFINQFVTYQEENNHQVSDPVRKENLRNIFDFIHCAINFEFVLTFYYL